MKLPDIIKVGPKRLQKTSSVQYVLSFQEKGAISMAVKMVISYAHFALKRSTDALNVANQASILGN